MAVYWSRQEFGEVSERLGRVVLYCLIVVTFLSLIMWGAQQRSLCTLLSLCMGLNNTFAFVAQKPVWRYCTSFSATQIPLLSSGHLSNKLKSQCASRTVCLIMLPSFSQAENQIYNASEAICWKIRNEYRTHYTLEEVSSWLMRKALHKLIEQWTGL